MQCVPGGSRLRHPAVCAPLSHSCAIPSRPIHFAADGRVLTTLRNEDMHAIGVRLRGCEGERGKGEG